ncbi:MAG TPA: pilus assembly protein [Lachnospiraceae bacterium]|nr:pilus assembly protein [Lachnospiraceae bacterium]
MIDPAAVKEDRKKKGQSFEPLDLIPSITEEVRRLSVGGSSFDPDAVTETIYEIISACHRQYWIPLHDRRQIVKRVRDALLGLDVLQPLVDDQEITDIMVNGADHIFYEKGGKIYASPLTFESEESLQNLVQRIVGAINRTVNESNPIVDARLSDGSRVNVVLPPVSLSGTVLTIRKFRKQPIRMEDLIRWGTATQRTAAYLEQAVRDRKNLFVCGGTASGKTTLLNILSSYIDPAERVITIEDSAELRLEGLPNVVTLETRNANMEGKGQITMRDLIKTSLRMNPDRIIVGEVRGAEALDMLSGLNTGHAGMSTGHANSCRDMLRRIETMVWMGADIPLEAIRQEIASALDLLVFVEKDRDGKRRIKEITKVGSYTNGDVALTTLMKREGDREVWQQGS